MTTYRAQITIDARAVGDPVTVDLSEKLYIHVPFKELANEIKENSIEHFGRNEFPHESTHIGLSLTRVKRAKQK